MEINIIYNITIYVYICNQKTIVIVIFYRLRLRSRIFLTSTERETIHVDSDTYKRKECNIHACIPRYTVER